VKHETPEITRLYVNEYVR